MIAAFIHMAALFLPLLATDAIGNSPRSFDFYVTPPLVERKVAAGTPFAVEVTFYNRDSAPLTLRLGRADLTMDLAGDVRVVASGNPDFSCKTWLIFPDSALRIPGGGRITIPVTVQVPSGMRTGRYGVLVARTEIKPARADEITLVGQTGAIFMLQPAVRARLSAQIREIDLTREDGQAMRFQIRVRNDGDVHFRAKGYILIKNSFDKIVDRVPLQMGTGTILPLHERLFSAQWNNKRKMLPGAYRAVFHLQVPGLAKVLQEVRDFSL